jgi:hypothetical protein
MSNRRNAHSLNKYFQCKNKEFKAQFKEINAVFFEQPQTFQEVTKETYVMRSNICWHVREWRKGEKIVALKKRKCSISGYPYVNELSTNPRFLMRLTTTS